MSNSLVTWDRAKDVLTILVVPALMWVASVSTNLELIGERVARQEAELKELRTDLETQRQRSIETNERLARVETRLVGLTERIDEIKQLLQRLVP